MNNAKAQSKRGRPKRKNSDQIDYSDELVRKKSAKKSQKAAPASKKTAKNEKTDKKKTVTKSKVEIEESSDSVSEVSSEVKEENTVKMIAIPLELFKPDKLFAEILNKANKQPEFLIMLRNLLSGCSRILRDKKIFLKKKWEQLRMSNCTQDEYLSRQSELKRMEIEQIYEIERDIMSKLSYANVKGFELRDAIIQDFKHKAYLDNKEKEVLQTEFYIDDQVWDKYHEEQKKLLSLLMNEKDLVFSTSMDIRSSAANFQPSRENKPNHEENQIDLKFSNIETEQNPQTTQFLFCKHFSEINYDKVFENDKNPFKLNEGDIYYMDPKALSWILQTKSDEVYTNEKFQKETFKRYTEMLQRIYAKSHEMSDEKLIENILQIAAYILNSVHYYQKFKLKCDLLHPLDLLLVIEKIKKERKNREAYQAMLEENFMKEIEGIAATVKAIDDSHPNM